MIAMIQAYAAPSPLIELACTVNNSTATVTANEDLGTVLQNDKPTLNNSVTRNAISYTVYNRVTRNQYATLISRVDGHMTLTVTLGSAKQGDKPVILSGMCRRIVERAF